ncbi:MAG UNVERIFIED_CONTAM: glycosyltransferase [Rickettsiaceae bacterium]
MPTHLYLEPFGIIVLEAMAYHVPVIATKTNGPVEIIKDKEDGILIDTGSPEQLSDAIKLSNWQMMILQKLLHTNALLTVKERYDIRVVSKILVNILNKVRKK